MAESRLSAVILSRGSTWNPQPWEPPYLTPDMGDPFPDGTATMTFYDTAGATLATVTGAISPEGITFTADPDVVDLIPAGANFEVVLVSDSGVSSQIRYGKVMRREATFFNSPAVTTTVQALQFTDTFPTLGLRSSWQPVAGVTQVFDNSADSLPNAIGARFEVLAQQVSAVRWFAPLNGNSVRVKVNLLQQAGPIGDTAAKTTVIVCADQRFTSYLGVQFVENGHKIHFCKGTAPNTVTYVGSEISNTVADGDTYDIYYDNAADTIYVYKGTDLTPLGSWNDSTHSVPHGPGHRYAGLAWDNTFLQQGLLVSYWSAKDDV